jgi:hypothetical protein
MSPTSGAYEHYLTGRAAARARLAHRAREELQRAVEIDPQFAEAMPSSRSPGAR